ncbi:MAG: DUF2141 domain-containing protein [Flavobacteriaceae bacterium]|nr:DUF2141 domain-containing protein [Flavobacteriaceae bacterium]
MASVKKITFLFLLFILFSFNEKEVQETYTLTVVVKHLRNSKGVVQFALYNKEGSIPDQKYKKYLKKDIALIHNDSSSVVFKTLPKGTYAVNILHDENKNGKIDKGFLLPKEGIGFTNYKTIGLGNKPKFTKANFYLNANTTKEIKVIYF